MENISTCIITDNPIIQFNKCEEPPEGKTPFIEYSVYINGKLNNFCFCLKEKCFDDVKKFIDHNRDALLSLLVTGKEIPQNHMRQSSPNRGYMIHQMDLRNFFKENNIETLREKLERYKEIIDNIRYINNDDSAHRKATKIASDIESLFPNNKNVKEWILILYRYNIYSENHPKQDALEEFTRKAKLDLGSIINSL